MALSCVLSAQTQSIISLSQEQAGTLLNMLEIHSWESAAIKADSLKIFLGVNPTFFAVNADLGPDLRANA
jgi:hypothetical protein